VLNENRLEGIKIDEGKLNFILADLRLNNDYRKYKNETDKNILEALGNIEMLEYVLSTNEEIIVWKMQKLQTLLYKYTPFGDKIIFPRQSNNRINGAQISTVDYKLIIEELIKIEEKIKKIINNKDNMLLNEYILETLKIHHKLTVIHPLYDGNGRVCRGILLWLLRLKNIPPLYIKLEDKYKYINALNIIDQIEDYDYLELFILEQIINSMVIFDEKLEL
jgi:Fic family protein